MAKKVNPRRRPATQADVKAALIEGIDLGVKQAIKMCLYILVDKHNAPPEDVRQLNRELHWLGNAINEGRISWSFVDKVLDENGLEVRIR